MSLWAIQWRVNERVSDGMDDGTSDGRDRASEDIELIMRVALELRSPHTHQWDKESKQI